MSSFFTIEKASHAELDFITIKSLALNSRADMCVYAPSQATEGMPVIILLHGVYGSHWSWALQGEAHLTLQKMMNTGEIPPMLLAMPSDGLFGDGSAYLPHKTADYESWITQDVPLALKETYPCINDSSPIFLGGLSMGGYGALRLGAKYPKLFRAFSGLSSITEFTGLKPFLEHFDQLEDAVLAKENVIDLMLKNKDSLPPFRFDCGREDNLLEANEMLHENLNKNGVPHEYYTYDGAHKWEYWKKNIRETFLFFMKNLP